MARTDTALVARAHGVATRLLGRPALEVLADAGDLPAFARGLIRLGAAVEPFGEAADARAIEQAIRQTSARHLRTLNRWQQHAPGVLDIVHADLDRRSLRSLIRGAAEGAPAAVRVAGLIPTPRFPERVLTELARQPSPRAVVGLLRVLGDADAALLEPLVTSTQPELFALDAALLAAWARRALDLARREDRTVRAFVQDRIDIGNAQVALLLAGSGPVDPSGPFVEGGHQLSRDDFVAAALAASPSEALQQLRKRCGGTRLGETISDASADVAALERASLRRTLSHLQREARLNPLNSAFLLHTLVRLEAQAHDLRWLAWGAALGAPVGTRKAQLVTP